MKLRLVHDKKLLAGKTSLLISNLVAQLLLCRLIYLACQILLIYYNSYFVVDMMQKFCLTILQTEGCGTEGGRGPATWDEYIQDGTPPIKIAVDSYHRYKVYYMCILITNCGCSRTYLLASHALCFLITRRTCNCSRQWEWILTDSPCLGQEFSLVYIPEQYTNYYR